MYGISRIDDPAHRSHAWRVTLRRQGKRPVKNFPDIKHGGKAKALKQARRYRDELMRRYPPTTRRQWAGTLRRNNRSGVCGVYRYRIGYRLKSGGKKRYLWYWAAHWPTEPREYATKKFSIKKLGEKVAFERACEARARGLRAVEGIFWACRR
jgi:hypothetical protein